MRPGDVGIHIGRRFFIKLTEANLGRIVYRHDAGRYIVISPRGNRSDAYDGFGDEHTEGRIEERISQLRRIFKQNEFSYIIAYAGYKKEGEEGDDRIFERFFIVYPYSVTKRTSADFEYFEEVLLEVGKDIGCDAVLVKAPGQSAVYVNCMTGETEAQMVDASFEAAVRDYADRMMLAGEGPRRLTFDGIYVVHGNNYMDRHSKYSINEIFF